MKNVSNIKVKSEIWRTFLDIRNNGIKSELKIKTSYFFVFLLNAKVCYGDCLSSLFYSKMKHEMP